jgi:hypothetical protein
MAHPDELNTALLTEALTEQAEARKGFYREFKIVLVAVLVFHFLVVPTFLVPAELDLQLQALSRQRDDVAAVQSELMATLKDLTHGREAFEVETAAMITAHNPALLKALCIEYGRTNICQAKPWVAPGATPTPSGAICSRQLSNAPAFQNPHDVTQSILTTLFDKINDCKTRLLDKPLAHHEALLTQLLKRSESSRKASYIDAVSILETVRASREAAEKSKLVPPDFSGMADPSYFGNPRWMVLLDPTDLKVLVGNSELSLKDALGQLEEGETTLQTEWDRLQENRTSLNNDVISAQQQLQSLLGTLGPFGVFSVLPPADTVLNFPVFILLAAIYFSWRYLLLHRRTQTLAAIYSGLGSSSEIVSARFAGVAEGSSGARPAARPLLPWAALSGFWAAAAGVALWSTMRVVQNPTLGDAAPRLAYVIAGIGFLVIIVVVSWLLLQKFPEKPAIPSTEKPSTPSESKG